MAILRSLPDLVIDTSMARPTLSASGSASVSAGNDHAVNSLKESTHRPLDLLMAGFEALDLVNVGLLVTSSTGRLLLANRTAERILKSRDGLELTPTGTVRTSVKSMPSLNTLMGASANSATNGARDSVLPLRRPSGKRPLTAVVRALDAMPASQDPAAPTTLLFILDPEIPVETFEAELRQLYGLTSMEACLANLLMQGKALDECCTLLQIRRSTARTHLQHLFEKVGVQRQSELVSLLLKSVGLVGAAVDSNKSRARSVPAAN
jgi:DNA-binding CsgD family transcriptional regulator